VIESSSEHVVVDWVALKPGSLLSGVDSGTLVEVIAVSRLPDTDIFNVVYRRRDGQTGVFVADDSTVGVAVADPTKRWLFNADPERFRLTIEAHRIRLAYLFDPLLAVHTSLVEPLPHQITAVYGELLSRHPLRFLLADDPGAGKTIMTGLFIRELMARGDLQRCLIIAPGSLVEQWQDELESKFHLRFDILTADQLEASGGARWFEEHPLAIARLDKLSRDEVLHDRLQHVTPWDLIVVDEAHKMAATVFGNEVKRTKRYQLGQLIAPLTRHLLLLSATPHNGKEADFQLFMALLDPDRFEGRYRDERGRVNRAELGDLMRRLVKEKLLRFDGRRLFPERRASTVAFELSPLERELYDAVSAYVRDQFNRADRLEGRRRGNVGFALTILQRRLASSSAAIAASLTRRRTNLEKRLQEAAPPAPDLDLDDPDELDDLPDDEREAIADRVVDESTAARTEAELRTEIEVLKGLEALATRVRRDPESDAKWRQLSNILSGSDLLTTGTWQRRKFVIFTEHRDTLTDLVQRIRALRGREDSVVVIHGGMRREQRKAAEEAFRNDPTVEVLVATDAAGEGINLQRAHLMANYDLPWNPNRIEQRFGRIHRIGQTEVCHLWNFIANGTREGDVFAKLFTKMDEQRKMLGDGIFDILGEFFRDVPLRDLLLDAVRHNESPEVRLRFEERLDNLLDVERAKTLMAERALAADTMDLRVVQQVRAEMERAEARRLQPHFIRSFFLEAFRRLGGTVRSMDASRCEIRNVPLEVRNRARQIAGAELPRRYERVAFDKSDVAGPPPAAFICPGHPLLDAVVDLTIAGDDASVHAGTVLIDPNDSGRTPRLLFVYEAALQDGRPRRGGGNEVVWRDLCFVERTQDGVVRAAGYAPHLDYRPATDRELESLQPLTTAPWLNNDVEEPARAFAIGEILPLRRRDLEATTRERIDRTMTQVRERLVGEITFHERRAVELDEAARAGKQIRLNADRERLWADDLRARLQRREDELNNQKRLTMLPPRLVGTAFIVPAGFFAPVPSAPDAAARAEVERIAIEAVTRIEHELGFIPRDVSAQNLGYDIESACGDSGRLRFLEVKGRDASAPTVTVTKNEILTGLNKPEDFILALVLVTRDSAPVVRYVRRPFTREPDFAATSVTYNIAELVANATDPS
jgi:SNF2 family DNA or RNA helicase